MTTESDVMEKIKKFTRENWTRILMLLLISASVVCIMLDIVKYFNISKFYSPYIVIIPLGLGICMKNFCIRREKTGQIENVVFVLCTVIVEYLFLIMRDKLDVGFQAKTLIYLLTSGSVLLFFIRNEISMSDKHKINEDYDRDKKKNCYNPLTFVQEEQAQDLDTWCRLLLTSMMSECAKSFERLPILLHADILRNILYSGVWSKYEYLQIKKRRTQEKAKKKEHK